jgi:hypothetical protein
VTPYPGPTGPRWAKDSLGAVNSSNIGQLVGVRAAPALTSALRPPFFRRRSVKPSMSPPAGRTKLQGHSRSRGAPSSTRSTRSVPVRGRSCARAPTKRAWS